MFSLSFARRSSLSSSRSSTTSEAAAIAGATRVGEQVRPGTLPQELDDLLAAAHVPAARAAERLAQRAGDDVDPVRDPVQLRGPAPVLADEPDGVRVVDHHHGVVALGQVADLAQRRDVAVHREDAVGRDQPAPCAGGLLQLLLEVAPCPGCGSGSAARRTAGCRR